MIKLPTRSFSNSAGFNRLTSSWLQRQAMQKVIEKQNKVMEYNKLSFPMKFKSFWMTKKRRIFYVFVIFLANYYHWYDRFTKFVKRKVESNKFIYRRRWTLFYNPGLYNYKLIRDGFKQSSDLLHQHNVDKLAKLLLDVDGKLRYGFSRELIVRVLETEEMRNNFGK
jgi:hypothetical protein